ncbi:MAG TPA: hypothetical protein PKA27_00855 [Fimbriimonadaceae bacterium]|nr:hypothetical protein [Fimbriimonadaceae bacterium]
MKRCLLSLSALFAVSTSHAAHIYVMSSQDAATDNATMSMLSVYGHTGTLGSSFNVFDGTESLAGYDAVYFIANYNWAWGDMPNTGQEAIRQYVANGGGLVTAEWVGWKVAVGQFQILNEVLPITNFGSFGYSLTETFTRDESHPKINNLLPNSFSMNLTSYAGTTSYFTGAKPGATSFYRMSDPATSIGLAGWSYGMGRVASFATTNGPDQIVGAGGRLLSNVFEWATLKQNAQPFAIITTEGEEFAGDANSVLGLYDDDAYASFNSPSTLQCSIIMGGVLTTIPTQLTFSAITRATRPGLAVGVAFWDYTAGVYRFAEGQVAATSFTNVVADAPQNVARFRDGAGTTAVRMSWLPINDEDPAQDGWLHEIDFAGWTYETN